MACRLVWSILLAYSLCLTSGIQAQDDFPTMKNIYQMFYQSEVEIVDLNLQVTFFAKEYYDGSQNRGRLEVLAFGNKQSIFYYNETDEILEVNSTTCQTWLTDESEFYYHGMFYGWLNKDPLILGPSAMIWYAQNVRDRINKSETQERVRDIDCDKFSLDIIDDANNTITIDYYFADKGWTTPYMLDSSKYSLRVPIRIAINGQNSKGDEQSVETPGLKQIVDFVYFRPTIKDWLDFQPPYGLGCLLRKPTMDMPKIPKMYKLTAETYDLLNAQNTDETDIDFEQLWYDGVRKMGRLDKYTRLGYSSELYDFNTGVTYVIKNGETCKMRELKDSFFESYDYDLVGHFKDPEEVLLLDGSFYYMGENMIRGIKADVFETVLQDVSFSKQHLKKLVVTAFFTKEFMEVAVDGEPESKVLIYLLLTGYDLQNKISLKLQYNIFAFDDVIYPAMYTTFQLERCFPLSQQKSYFIMILNVSPQLAAIIEGQNNNFIEQLKYQIVEHAKVSDLRIPLLKADYKTSGVYVTGLMLDRPPALTQFWYGHEEYVITTDRVKILVEAATKEECAFACVNEGDFTCRGFYMCGNACFLKTKGILDDDNDPDDDHMDLGTCQIFIRAERDSNNDEAYLADALQKLEKAVLDQVIKVDIIIDSKTEKIAPIQDIVIGDGPYSGNNSQDKPYKIVFEGFQLLSESDSESTQEISYVDTLNDCYKSCKNSESLSCSSFSYCSNADNKQCRISSVLIAGGKENYGDITPNSVCKIYSLKYLDFYEPYPGKVIMVNGDKALNQISSLEECAKNCRSETDFICRGFEYCRNKKACVLHNKHVMDFKGGEVADSKQTKCIHYAAKYSADYQDMGYTLVDDNSNPRGEISLEECARACSEEMDTCKSFNFCPQSAPYMTDSSCSLSTMTLRDRDVKTTIKDKCHHYSKRDDVEDWARMKKSNMVNSSGYTSKGFTNLVIGMLVLGLVLGALAFVGYSYMRSRSSDEGMTVRFMKQADT